MSSTAPSSAGPHAGTASASAAECKVLAVVFSHSERFRAELRMAVGRRPAPDLGRIEWIECVTGDEVVAQVDAGGVDLLVLDGEAQPTGGMGICRQLKDEIEGCPQVLLVVARRDDTWLARWSRAEAVISQPLDPVTAGAAVADLLRGAPQPR